MVDIELVTKVSENVFSGYSQILVNSSKILAGTIFIVGTTQKMMKAYAETGSLQLGKANGIGPYDLLRILGILILIAFIPEILGLIDKILNGIFSLFWDEISGQVTILEMNDIPVNISTEEDSVMNSILQTLLELKSELSPIGMLTRAILGIGYFLDILVFLIFLGKRFFILGVIKILSPLMVAFAIFPKYHDLVYNVGKVYTRTFLTIIPLLLVNIFANEFYKEFMEYMTSTTERIGTMFIVGDTIRAIAVMGLIWLKIKLFKQSSEIMKSLWP